MFSIPRNFFRAALSPETGGPCADFETPEAECCTGVTSEAFGDSRWLGRACGASATNERDSAAERPYGCSGGEVEPLGRGLGIVSGRAHTNPATYFTWEAAIEPRIGKRGARFIVVLWTRAHRPKGASQPFRSDPYEKSLACAAAHEKPGTVTGGRFPIPVEWTDCGRCLERCVSGPIGAKRFVIASHRV